MSLSLSKIEKNEFYYALVGLAIIILISNAPHFFLDYLVHDDSYIYKLYSEGRWRINSTKFHLLLPYVEWPLFKLMVVTSPGFARFVSVFLFMVPSALCLYVFYRRIWGLVPVASFFAAVVPFIIPFQLRVPAGLNNGYILPTTLAASLLMLIGGLFITKSELSVRDFIFTVLLVVFIVLYAPNAPFVLAAISVLFLSLLVINRRRSFVLLLMTISGMALTIWHQIHTPRKKAVPFTLEETLNRLEWFIRDFIIPVPNSMVSTKVFGVYLTISLVVLTMTLVLISIYSFSTNIVQKPYHFRRLSEPRFGIMFLMFCFGWVFLTAFPFLTVVPNAHQSRYFWFSGIGVAALLPFVLKVIPDFTLVKKVRLTSIVLIALTLSIAGAKFFGSLGSLESKNKISEAIRNNLTIRNSYPEKSQVIYISDHKIPQSGVSVANTGFVWYLLGNKNIEFSHIYLPHKERYWYNPLKIEAQSWWTPQLNGLKISKPLFIYKDINKQFRTIPMFLQVETNSVDQEVWTIYKLDSESGKSELFASGIGEAEYLDYLHDQYGHLEKKSIEENIAFGVPPELVN